MAESMRSDFALNRLALIQAIIIWYIGNSIFDFLTSSVGFHLFIMDVGRKGL